MLLMHFMYANFVIRGGVFHGRKALLLRKIKELGSCC